MEKDNTLEYYNASAKHFAKATKDVDFKDVQERFLKYLAPGSKLLDYGCGAGRDTRYFLNRGYQVDAVDGSEELVKIASEHTGIEVKQMLFQELNSEAVYDGIWACASILHLNRDELLNVFYKIETALVSRGIFYTSFKYGTGNSIRDGRYFMDMTEDKLKSFSAIDTLFSIEEQWKTTDVRPDRCNEEWLNIILKKKN